MSLDFRKTSRNSGLAVRKKLPETGTKPRRAESENHRSRGESNLAGRQIARSSLSVLRSLGVAALMTSVIGCDSNLDPAAPLAEIKQPNSVMESGNATKSGDEALVSTIGIPTLSDLSNQNQAADRSSDSLDKPAGSSGSQRGPLSRRWTVETDFALASSIENVISSGVDSRSPEMRLVQKPGDDNGPGVTPEIIPTPEGKPDPSWKPKNAPTPTPAPIEPKLDQPGKSPDQAPMQAPTTSPESSANKSAGSPKTKAAENAASDAVIKVAEAKPMANSSTSVSRQPNAAIAKPASEMGLEPEDYQAWDVPTLALVFTGNQHGYIEPCGCTGLERQKGGVARRFTFIKSLREMNWPVLPMDVGNLVRRTGDQANIKLQQSVRALKEMQYQAVGFGPSDIRLGAGELLSVAAGESADETMYVSANVVLIDPELMPQQKVIDTGSVKIGVTSILDPESLEVQPSEELLVEEMVASTKLAIEKLQAQSPDYNVLLFYGDEKSAQSLVRDVDGFDLVVVAGGYGEPTYQANAIEGSQTRIIVTGDKGMYAGIVGLFDRDPNQRDPNQTVSKGAQRTANSDKLAMRYARVPLTHEFDDAPAMRTLMKDYQNELKNVGLERLGLLPPIPHPSGHKFVGAETCGKCHTEAMDVWEGSAHAHATQSIISPPEDRGDVARHFDPECISCHVTGWNAQSYYPYATGYLSLESTAHLTGNGCENCHGPGAEHSAAEEKDSGVSQEIRDQLRLAMQLPLEQAKEKCMTCHDLDNSPDFHEPDAFEDIYWPDVEHYGVE